jgi:hypothetical protein
LRFNSGVKKLSATMKGSAVSLLVLRDTVTIHMYPLNFFFFFSARQYIAPDAPQLYAYCAALNFHFSTDSAASCL